MVIELRPPSDANYERTSINLLILDLNKHMATQDYAMVTDRSKVDEKVQEKQRQRGKFRLIVSGRLIEFGSINRPES